MDEQPTTPIPPQPIEQAAWVPTQPNTGQPPVPAQLPKKGMPLILKVMIGCGALVFILPIIVVAFIVGTNPLGKVNTAQDRSVRANIRTQAEAVNKCIEAEKIKGTASTIIYSDKGCAGREFLYANKYQTDVTFEAKFLANEANTKVCIYSDQYGRVVSWDSSQGVVSEAGKGKSTCE